MTSAAAPAIFNTSLFRGDASALVNGSLVSQQGPTASLPHYFYTPPLRIDNMAGERVSLLGVSGGGHASGVRNLHS